MRHLSFAFCFLLFSLIVFSQEKKTISHDDYAMWKQISSPLITHDASWILFEVNPQDGDGVLIIKNLKNLQEVVIDRGRGAAVSPGGKYAVFRIKPQKSLERQAKVEKRKRDEMPADSLGIFIFATGQLIKYPALENFKLPKESSDWLTYVIDPSRLENHKGSDADSSEKGGTKEGQPETPPEKEEMGGGEEDEDEDKGKQEDKPGKILLITNPITGETLEVSNINDHLIAEYGNLVAGLTEKKEKDTLSVWELVIVETSNLHTRVVDSRRGDMKQLNIDAEGNQVVWMFSADTTDQKSYTVYHHNVDSDQTSEVIYPDMPGMPEAYGPSEYSRPYFSDNGQRLFVGTAPLPLKEPEDTLLNEEKYSLDIWHWQDSMLQSQQKAMLNQLRRRSFQAVFHIGESRLVQLGDEDLRGIQTDAAGESRFAMGQDPDPYMIERQWTAGNPRDLYYVSMLDGGREKVTERIESTANISPDGNYLLWYDTESLLWKAFSFARETTTNLTGGIDVAFYNEENDLPMFAQPHGVAGWTPNDRHVLIYDRYDIWKVDPNGYNPPQNITNGYGQNNKIRLRIQNLDPDDEFVRLDGRVYLSAFDENNIQSGFFVLDNLNLDMLIMEDASFSGLQKAKNAEKYVFRRSTFNEYPDIWVSGKDFSDAERVSDANPQQSDYLWGSVRLVEWQDFDNETLKGLIYFPENLDESKKYPLLVYFYERSSQGLHSHSIPSPSRSVISRPYCTSNGYIVFVPDVTYKIGYPGESAYNAIVSGTKAMTERFPFIDRENMGLQGQSWGGYQIAYLVTRTNMFKAAMAGAPVSNMVSAYGGIRWQSGLNRQFQYEQTQSRIGGSLWEKPLRYIENSPVFFADKIETPLLMMHNDDDGAVPWYQGIELFTAMRRLSKPVWMLVYNGEAHNLTKWPNRMDLSVRMYQFFDHYLKGAPAPIWLRHGIPATEKGKTDAYELID